MFKFVNLFLFATLFIGCSLFKSPYNDISEAEFFELDKEFEARKKAAENRFTS